MCEPASYALRIDGPLLRNQRRLLGRLFEAASSDARDSLDAHDDRDLLMGIVELLDEIADQAHDRHGIDCLEPGGGRCECEEAGYFNCGVPGILAHLTDGRLPADASVERCDLRRRYPSDEAARQKLRELGYIPP